MTGAPRGEDAAERPSLARAAVVPVIAFVALLAILWPHLDDIVDASGKVSIKAGVALVLLHLLALVLRAEAWGRCVAAAGTPVPRKALHASSALRFLADTLIPTYVGAWVRIALLRRYVGKPPQAPTIGQMFTADGLLLFVEGVITIALVVIAVFASSIEWWWLVAFGGIVGASLILIVFLYGRYRDREFVKTIEVLRSPRERAVLTGILAIVLTVQPVRFWLAFNAVGLDPSAADALIAFLLTSLYAVLPIGPGPSVVAATATLFSGATVALIGSSGLILVATAVVAAAIYSAWGLLALSRLQR